jgi:lambda repressor-like predicted transcriptional regulator
MSEKVVPFRPRPLHLRAIVAKLVAAGVTPARLASEAGVSEAHLRDWLSTPGAALAAKPEAALTAYVRNLRKSLAANKE